MTSHNHPHHPGGPDEAGADQAGPVEGGTDETRPVEGGADLDGTDQGVEGGGAGAGELRLHRLPRPVLTICGDCRQLSGRLRKSPPRRAYQCCHCEYGSDLATDEFRPHYPWLLCHTCAAVPIQRFTKWASAHCGRCCRHVDELNRTAGAVVIPRGWHTIVNAASARPRRWTRNDPTQLHRDLARIHIGFTLLADWRRKRIDWLCDQAGLPTDTDLVITDYLDAVHPIDHAAAFSDLLAHINHTTLQQS